MTTTPAELIAEAERIIMVAQRAAHKLEAMYKRSAVSPRAELEWLMNEDDNISAWRKAVAALEAAQAGSRPQTHADLVAAHRALNGSTALSAARAVNRGWSPPQGSGDYVLARQLPDDVFADVVSWIKTAHRDMADADCDAETVAENVAVNIWDVLRAMISASDGGPQ